MGSSNFQLGDFLLSGTKKNIFQILRIESERLVVQKQNGFRFRIRAEFALTLERVELSKLEKVLYGFE